MLKAAIALLSATAGLLVSATGAESISGLSHGHARRSQKYVAPWETMRRPPPLPVPNFNGSANVNGIDLWYYTFGATLNQSQALGLSPVVFLHGGFANSEYFSHQIHYLKDYPYTLIAIDSRAQGRSTDDLSQPITYDIMTQDVIALMDTLHIERFSVVGWSDGGIIGFDLAMNYTERIDRVFSFGGSYSPNNINSTIENATTWQTYEEWIQEDYNELSRKNETFETFEERLNTMWSTEPTWNATSFQKIPTLFDDADAPIIWIVDGDSEEAVTRTTPGELHSFIWGSSLVLLPSVSHFGFLQDPLTFNRILERFLEIPH